MTAGMNLKMRYVIVGMVVVSLLALGCSSGSDAQQAQQAFEQGSNSSGEMPEGHPDVSGMTGQTPSEAPNSIAGIAWQVPEGWTVGAQRQMRAATYEIAAAEGDPEGAECAVFYFGPDQGGSVEANIDRWISQFQQADGGESKDVAKRGSMEVDGLKCSTVEVTGNYTGAMGPMGGDQSAKENFRMLGAIVEAPKGAVFFKMYGPDKTVESAHAAFNAMVKSVKKIS